MCDETTEENLDEVELGGESCPPLNLPIHMSNVCVWEGEGGREREREREEGGRQRRIGERERAGRGERVINSFKHSSPQTHRM